VLSLLLCIGALTLWTRSDERRDEIGFHWRGMAYALASDRGHVGIDNRPQLLAFEDARSQAIDELSKATPAYLGREGPGSDPYIANQIQIDRKLHALMIQGPPAAVQYAIPDWTLVVAACVIPALWAARWHRRRVRIAAGQCAECGYDLRASTNRCPECGTPIPSSARTAT
jgi:hypothetical protein